MEWTDEAVARARGDTPGVANVIHFNNAGCALPTRQTLDATLDYVNNEGLYGGYETFDRSSEALRRPYTALSRLLNCSPEEIGIVSSATEAWQRVAYGLAYTWRPGDRVLASVAEYGSNMIALLQLARRTGARIETIPETAEGDVCLEGLKALLAPDESGRRPVLLSLTHVPTSSGRTYDAEAVGRLAEAAGVPYLLDACQSAGQLPLDVRALRCDFLTATGRKYLRSPRGVGFLYASRPSLEGCGKFAGLEFEPAALDNTGATWGAARSYVVRGDARRYESYEMSFASKVGLGVAVEYLNALGIKGVWARIQHLAAALRAGLAATARVRVHDRGATLCGLVSFTKEGLSAEAAQQGLAERRINVSVSRVGSTRTDFEARGLNEVVRASVHYFNSEDEVQALVAAVDQL